MRTSLLWLTTIEILIGASLNRRKRMKAEPSRQIPHKLTTKLQRLLLQLDKVYKSQVKI